MNKTGRAFLLESLKSALIALIISAILLFCCSILLAFVPLSTEILVAVNQGIKCIGLLIAEITCFKTASKGLWKGLTCGVVYALLAYLFTSVLEGFSLDGGTLLDGSLTVLIGTVCGIIAVTIKKKG